MKVTRFDRKRDLIITHARVWGVRGHERWRLAVDTGSSDTVIGAELIENLGYA